MVSIRGDKEGQRIIAVAGTLAGVCLRFYRVAHVGGMALGRSFLV